MAKKIYWQTILKKALLIGVPIGITGFGLLFWYLSALGVIDVTGHSGDLICAGTIEDPCLAYINFTANEDIFIYPVNYDPWGRDTPFETDTELESWKMYRSWGTGWREIKLNETCTGTWCGAPNNLGVKYSFVFRKGRDYQIKIVAYKKHPYEEIKWSFTDEVDPTWGSVANFTLLDNTDDCLIDCEAHFKMEVLGNFVLKREDIAKYYLKDKDANDLSSLKFKVGREEELIRQKWISNASCNPYNEIVNETVVEQCNWSDDGYYIDEVYEEIVYDDFPNEIDFETGDVYYFEIKGKKTPKLGENNVDWKMNILGYELPYAWWNSNWDKCKNISIGAGVTLDNAIMISNLTGLTFSSTDEIRIVNTYCRNDGTEVKSSVFQNGSDWTYTTFLANLSGAVNYSVYYDNDGASARSNELSDDFCEFSSDGRGRNNYCGWTNVTDANYSIQNGHINITHAGLYSPINVGLKNVLVSYFRKLDASYDYTGMGLTNGTGTSYFLGGTTIITSLPDSRSGGISEIYVKGPSSGEEVKSPTGLSGAFNRPVFHWIEVNDTGGSTINSVIYNSTTLVYDFPASTKFSSAESSMHLYLGGNAIHNYPIDHWYVDYIRAYDTESKFVPFTDLPTFTLGSEEVKVPPDDTNPNVTINTPLNQSYPTNTIDFNVTAVDETAMGDCNYTLNNGVTNYTMQNISTSQTYWNATNLTMSQGSSTARFICWDTSNNLNNTEQVTLFIDSVNPDVNITYPLNNSNHSINTVDVNYTFSDSGVGIETCWYSNDSYTINTTISCGTNITTIIWIDGNHNVTVWANDTLGNENSSRVTFTLDTTKPDINITSPLNNTNHFNLDLDINYTRSDATLDSCWYSNDTMSVNTTLADCGNITDVTWSYSAYDIPAQHNVTIWANDTFGNENSSSISFTVEVQTESNVPYTEIELGSTFNITANITTGVLCVDIDHPDFGINYSCGSNVNFEFNISSFRKTVTSNASSTIVNRYTNSSSYDVLYLNFSSHQYDEVDDLRLNISGNLLRDVAFYKVNTTDFDRVYMGYLLGNDIYLNKSCDAAGTGTCVYTQNLTFSNPGDIYLYFYLDDNIQDFNFILNLTGSLYGFEFNDSFENYDYIDKAETTAQLDLSGTIMPPNSSLTEFEYDNFNDSSINTPDLWLHTADDSFGGPYDYIKSTTESDGYIEQYVWWRDPDAQTSGALFVDLWTNKTNLNLYTTDYISLNLSSEYISIADVGGESCDGRTQVYLGNALVWTSSHVETSSDDPTESGVSDDMRFELTKINTTSWQANIIGYESSDGIAAGDKYTIYEVNWTSGIFNKTVEGVSEYINLNNTFDFAMTHDTSIPLLVRSILTKTTACVEIQVTTGISYVNNSKWSRTNGTVQSTSVFDSAGNIASATFTLYGHQAPNEVLYLYVSADDGENWESINTSVEHSFVNPGKHIKWRIDFTNVTIGWLNDTSYITNIEITTTESNPSNITLDFGDDGITSYTLWGEINSTNGTIAIDLSNHSLTNAFTSRRSLYDHLYIIPLKISSDSKGLITIGTINITYNPNPVILNTTSIQDFLDISSGVLNFTIPIGTYVGNLTLDNFIFDYAGGNETINITIHSTDYSTYLNQTDVTLWYSRWDWVFGSGINYLEFIPKIQTSKNVSAYGQSDDISIFNLTNYGYGGRKANLSIYINDTLSCVNLTMSLNKSKVSGFQVNDSWVNIKNTTYLDLTSLWMWADYECDYSSWYTFNPYIYFRQCCEDCFCSEDV